MQKLCLWTLVFVVTWASITLSNGAEITTNAGGYEGVVVAIHRNVPENPVIVQNIKEMFIRGSAFLFNSTRGRLYFKRVTIVIPETWTEEYNQTLVFSDYFSDAHVRVAEPNPDFQDAPYTLQPGECGDQGEYIHFTPKFLSEIDSWTFEMYGDSGRQLVHEWGHFRFGVYDEYGSVGDRRFPLFYLDNNKIMPTSCTKDVKGWVEQENGDPCTVYQSGLVGDECRFIPDISERGQEMDGSIMYMPFLPTVTDFCDKASAKESKRHNWRAPTKQNAFCQYKSTWEVISSHVDIKNGLPLPENTNTKTDFNVVRFAGSDARRTVLVMDSSSSMNGYNRLEKLRTAAERFIMDTIPWNVSLGMVEFNSNAKTLIGMTKIENATSRRNLAAKIPIRAPGSTAIGQGLREALKVLRENNGTTEGATIILISDGEQNVKPFIEEMFDEVQSSGARVNTIAIGSSATIHLETMASKTGGRSFYFLDSDQNAAGLDSAFASSTASQVDVEFRPISHLAETLQIILPVGQKNIEVIQAAIIDKELGKNAIFTFRSSQLKNVEIKLKSPSGKWYREDAPEFDSDLTIKKRKIYTIGQAESGTWNIVFNASSTLNVATTLTSEVRDSAEQPIRVKSWFDKMEIAYPAYVKVLARVTKGYNVVLDATVTATIIRPNAQNVDITLRDNGAGADSLKDDGIYSSFFYEFTGNGRYAAFATVNNDGNAKLKLAGSGNAMYSGAMAIPKERKNKNVEPQSEFDMTSFRQIDEPIPDAKFETEPVDDFLRNVDLGNFQLSSFTGGSKDVIAPNRVTDFQVVDIVTLDEDDEEDETDIQPLRNVSLLWTAAGDNMDQGKAGEVDIRGSLDGGQLLLNFEKALPVIVYQDTLEAGTPQRVYVQLPLEMSLPRNKTEGYDIYFALKSVDKAGNVALMSNIAAGHIGYHAPPLIKDEVDPKIEVKSHLGVILGVIAGVLVVIGLIAGLVMFLRRR